MAVDSSDPKLSTSSSKLVVHSTPETGVGSNPTLVKIIVLAAMRAS